MENTAPKLLRFSQAALAAGVTAPSLRYWMDDLRIKLASPLPDTGHWRGGYLDIAILALTRVLGDFGIPISTANDLAYQAITKLDPSASTEDAARSGALLKAWRDCRLQVCSAAPDWYTLDRVDLRKSFTMPPGPISAPQFFALCRRDTEPQDAAFLQIDVAGILAPVFARADEILESAAMAAGEVEEFAVALTDAFARQNAPA